MAKGGAKRADSSESVDTQSRPQAAKPGVQRKRQARFLEETPALYFEAWRAYCTNTTIGGVRDALGCTIKQAQGLIANGMPKHNLQPLREKLQQLMSIANRLDRDEGARAVAIGRGALHTIQARLIAGLPSRTFSPATLSDRDYIQATLAVHKRVEEVHADTDDGQQQLRAEENLGRALGGLLETIVKRLLPNVGDSLPTVEDLEALDLPQTPDVIEGEVLDD